MRPIAVTEGEPIRFTKADEARVRDAVSVLTTQLRPRLSLLRSTDRGLVLRNVVGSVDLGGNASLQVAPKVAHGQDWVTAVVSLLTGEEGIHIAGERPAGVSENHRNLLDAIAGIYLRRLQRAFRQEGPLVLMERREAVLPHLQGSLNVSKWARQALWRPHMFPVARTAMVTDNLYSRNLIAVAKRLAGAASQAQVRSGLNAVIRDLSGGLGAPDGSLPTKTAAVLPEQWNAYKPAWSLATAVLNKTSLLGSHGRHLGVGMAIEAWPLLETHLERTLRAVQRSGQQQGRSLTYQMQASAAMLRPQADGKNFRPQPDGVLREGDVALATFEAKYASFDGELPERNHIYQAVSTAAAFGARVAVLVYPESFEPMVWDTSGFATTPRQLIVLGLDLFRWLTPHEAERRGYEVLDMLDRVIRNAPAANLRVSAQ